MSDLVSRALRAVLRAIWVLVSTPIKWVLALVLTVVGWIVGLLMTIWLSVSAITILVRLLDKWRGGHPDLKHPLYASKMPPSEVTTISVAIWTGAGVVAVGIVLGILYLILDTPEIVRQVFNSPPVEPGMPRLPLPDPDIARRERREAKAALRKSRRKGEQS